MTEELRLSTKMDVVVTGIGLVSALGNLENSWKRLLAGDSGIERYQPFLELEPQLLALVGTKPADLISLIQQVLADALQDADLTWHLPDCGIVIGSSRGFQGNLEQLVREGSSATGNVRDLMDVTDGLKKSEGSSATDSVTDVTDVRQKEEGTREKEEGRECPIPNSQFPIPNLWIFCLTWGRSRWRGLLARWGLCCRRWLLVRRAYSRSPVLLI